MILLSELRKLYKGYVVMLVVLLVGVFGGMESHIGDKFSPADPLQPL